MVQGGGVRQDPALSTAKSRLSALIEAAGPKKRGRGTILLDEAPGIWLFAFAKLSS
jgi:hypothetical protein